MPVKLTGLENFANIVTLNFTGKACMCGQEPEIFGGSLGGCDRAATALLKASSGKRLGSRPSTAVGAKAAGGREGKNHRGEAKDP